MDLRKLQQILTSQPSVAGNTFLVTSLFVVSWILMVSLSVLAIGLFLESFLHYRIFLDKISQQLKFSLNDEQRGKIATSFGLVSLFLSVVFLGVIFLCRMILRRNHYIMEIEDWILGNVGEIKKTRKKK